MFRILKRVNPCFRVQQDDNSVMCIGFIKSGRKSLLTWRCSCLQNCQLSLIQVTVQSKGFLRPSDKPSRVSKHTFWPLVRCAYVDESVN